MSVLLEALKRAALEKKGNPALGEKTGETEDAEAVPPAMADSAQADSDAAESVESEFATEHHPDGLSDFEVLEEEEWDQHGELDIENFEDDGSAAADVNKEVQASANVEQEPAATTALEPEEEFELHDNETLQAFSAANVASKHDVEEALKEAAEKIQREQHEQAELEASKRAADRMAFLAQQKKQADALTQEQKSEHEHEHVHVHVQAQEQEQEQENEQALELAQEQAQTQNEQPQNEQPETEQLESQQRHKTAELKTAAKAQGENETALTHLVHKGHELNRRQKRRSRFLYAMLVITAVGGIFAYYFYLLGNNSLQRLTTERQANQEVVSLIGSGTTDVLQTGEMRGSQAAGTEQQVSQESASQVPRTQNSLSESTTLASTNTQATITMAGQQPALLEQQNTSAMNAGSSAIGAQKPARQANDTLPISLGETPIDSEVEAEASSGNVITRRSDQPPSANLIFSQFVGLESRVLVPEPASKEVDAPSRRVDNISIDADRSIARTQHVHIYHKATPTNFSSLIQQAYSAYQSNDLGTAGQLYDKALNLDPRNRDALLGAAAVASASGDVGFALRLYQLRLNEDPSDSYARAGLLTLSNHATLDTDAVDELLSSSPGAAHLHFLKGAIYAARAQWKEAQAAFFEAHHWDKANPDYAYNLAVSLDHLGLTDAAARYYQKSLELAGPRQTGFSADSVRRRLAGLGVADG